MIYYFAYGSNMDPDNMRQRGVEFSKRERAILRGWRLIFNKTSSKKPDESYANIVRDERSIVEGILYLILDIEKLDDYEGYPDHYYRTRVRVERRDWTEIEAFVYIANPEKTRECPKPSREYLNHLLKGCELLSEDYCK